MKKLFGIYLQLATLQYDSSSGDLQVEQVKAETAAISVSSGEAALDIPEDADFTLNGQASSGDIRCDLPLKKACSIVTIHHTARFPFFYRRRVPK
ncbi:DUF4097 family beta strand repeat-containing protein [Aneurinibacillus sp. REN35]|uniref:DUF4097 family beta strand repeat-containing protein n=1 Tax=Aneurinibacillus sp. REN35 TaxID=3237286 RepID=UPI00352767AF